MLVAHKIALDPNDRQATYFAKACGTARFAYNWGIREWEAMWQARKSDPSLPAPSEAKLRRRLNARKRESFPWMFDVTKCAAQEALIDLGQAYSRAFENFQQKKKVGRNGNPWGFPRAKKKFVDDSFCATNEVGKFRVEGRMIKLPVIGWVRMREDLRFFGVLKRATVSREADRWFVSILVETEFISWIPEPKAEVVGVDLGVKALATLSTGETVEGPKAHKKALKKLRRANKSLARKKKGSKNCKKQKKSLARIHKHIANKRLDATHKLTTRLARGFEIVGIEDLNVKGMAANGKLARSIMDGGFSEFKRQCEYKSKRYGATLVVAPMFYPSSKTCSCCGVVKETLALSQRIFSCDNCGLEIDRDLNAAINLARYAKINAASSAASACGEKRSGAKPKRQRVKRSSTKQEGGVKPNVALSKAA